MRLATNGEKRLQRYAAPRAGRSVSELRNKADFCALSWGPAKAQLKHVLRWHVGVDKVAEGAGLFVLDLLILFATLLQFAIVFEPTNRFPLCA